MDIAQLCLILTNSMGGGRVASLFRIVRVFRILRIIRVFRAHAMEELNLMLEGVSGEAVTLVWAVVLFFFMVYIFAVVCRIFLGRDEDDHKGDMYPYFSSVPRSMFTIFRCMFGDCTSEDG